MTKADLIKGVCQAADMTRHESEPIIETIFQQHRDVPASDDKVEIRGFGSFRIRKRQRSAGRKAQDREQPSRCPPRRFPISSQAKN
jgi:integration host factor subunit beta